jgi:hypothetical protein
VLLIGIKSTGKGRGGLQLNIFWNQISQEKWKGQKPKNELKENNVFWFSISLGMVKGVSFLLSFVIFLDRFVFCPFRSDPDNAKRYP